MDVRTDKMFWRYDKINHLTVYLGSTVDFIDILSIGYIMQASIATANAQLGLTMTPPFTLDPSAAVTNIDAAVTLLNVSKTWSDDQFDIFCTEVDVDYDLIYSIRT